VVNRRALAFEDKHCGDEEALNTGPPLHGGPQCIEASPGAPTELARTACGQGARDRAWCPR
jgi:hypothetical protein